MKNIWEKINKHIFVWSNGGEIPSLICFLFFTLIIGFIVPTLIFLSPSGSDVYTHVYNTLNMAESYSLLGFYETSFSEEYLGFDYPFGLWIFGSIVMKITGIDGLTLAYLLPLILFFVTIMIYYLYADKFFKSEKLSLFSILFLISMPLLTLNLLNYSSGIFAMLFLISIIFLALHKPDIKNMFILITLVFTLGFTHTGTYMFLIFFTSVYLILYAVIWKKMEIGMYILIVSLLFLYVLIAQIFPFVQPQYIDKGRFIISITESISSFSGIEFIQDFGKIFYDSIFVSNNYIYAIFWSSFIFMAIKLSLYFHSRLTGISEKRFIGIPFIGNINHISHGIMMTPFWMGPVQTFLSVFGIFRLDSKGKCIALSLIITALLPGAMSSAENVGTGALREIHYLYLIIPIAAVAGLFYILPVFKEYLDKRIRKESLKKGISVTFYLFILIPVIFVPVIGNLYYQPIITGSDTEKEHLIWLSEIGSPSEGIPDFLYRERIDLYADKVTPSVHSGSETKRYLDDLKKTYFTHGAEDFTKDLYSFNIMYIISSNRILKGYLDVDFDDLAIDSNKKLDKIFSASDNFGIYKYISEKENVEKKIFEENSLKFNEVIPDLYDFGSSYLFENDYYKVKISENSPEIKYYGTKTLNLLEDGFYTDYIGISISDGDENKKEVYELNNLDYSVISKDDDSIIYKTTIKSTDNAEKWATLIVKYMFYEKAFKREIIIANDWINLNSDSRMGVGLSSSIFAPVIEFEYRNLENGNKNPITKKIYPSHDSALVKDKKFDQIYFNEGNTGILLRYGDLVPYPDRIYYGGSLYYDLGNILVYSEYTLAPSESVNHVQYFSVGDKNTAEINIDHYSSVFEYPFSEGKIPGVITFLASEDELMDYSNGGLKTIDELNVEYNEVARIEGGNVPFNEINAVGYAGMYVNQSYQDLESQKKEINEIKHMTGANGVLFEYFKYNLDSVRALSEENMRFAEAYYVGSPFEEFNREGLRNPKIAYYHGDESGIVLIPVALPSSTALSSNYGGDEDTFSDWENTIDSVISDGGMAVFLWDAKDVGNPIYSEDFIGFINRSKDKGVTFTSLDEISAHYLMLQNISVNVTKGMDYAVFDVTNKHDNEITGVTYGLSMPLLSAGKYSYNVNNGRISREYVNDENYIMFVSFDLEGNERKKITVEPSIKRQDFILDYASLFEGDCRIIVSDSEGLPIENVYVYVNSRIFKTDENGEIKIDLRRGAHKIKFEKPGYNTIESEIEVNGRIYNLFK
ncbi:hypothetical protein F1737_06230 [Methanoplanus sp. FWC-SCC4]|uniref:Uncharacterized protein n=1 Tax=Methanochimaera problematica TaxID=2609417 RepID=A0AA97FBH2_9EURY|nr:hypothetical protein [Methanoplanus sp. FWC-SCC4]WOF16340.1 hypothetical protein F1737_06230 [Methanoplanus sp. FWC-SCC4]